MGGTLNGRCPTRGSLFCLVLLITVTRLLRHTVGGTQQLTSMVVAEFLLTEFVAYLRQPPQRGNIFHVQLLFHSHIDGASNGLSCWSTR